MVDEHLTEEHVLEKAGEFLDNFNINPDKLHEIAEKMGLEYDEDAGMYKNPDWENS